MRVLTSTFLLLVPLALRAQRTVLVVNVGEEQTGAFIADAQVRVPQLGRLVRTNWQGEARIEGLPAGDYRIQVRKLGYAPSDVLMRVSGDTAAAFFALERATTHLDTVRVLAQATVSPQLEQFYMHRRLGIARIIGDSVLAKARAQSLAVLFVSHFPVGIVPDAEGGWTVSSPLGTGHRSTLGGNTGPGSACDIFLDGTRYLDALEKIHPDELVGVEFYDDINAPVQYRNGGPCVLLLWSKWG